MTENEIGHLVERPIAISREELDRRRKRVWKSIVEHKSDLFVGMDAATIRYLTGYPWVSNERPSAIILDAGGELTFFVPLLKEHDVSVRAHVDHVVTYRDYPGEHHPIECLARLIAKFGASRILLEHDEYQSPHGYQGPAISPIVDAEIAVSRELVQKIRMVKSEEEIGLLRHASDWAVLAHRQLQDAVQRGRRESQVSAEATAAALKTMRQIYGNADRRMVVSAGFGGQIGADGTAHHYQKEADPQFEAGDLMITRVFAQIGGYYSDIERTLVCAHASPQTKDLFVKGTEIQAFALGLVHPGVAAGEIDRKVFESYKELGIEEFWRHHTGHSVGLLEREAPYVDIGTDTVLEPGMVVTIEPGIYWPGVGGFRHSDCVLVTQGASEVLTEYPRELDALTSDRTPRGSG